MSELQLIDAVKTASRARIPNYQTILGLAPQALCLRPLRGLGFLISCSLGNFVRS